MAQSCLLYYITDRRAFPGNESQRRSRLLEKIAEAANAGVDYIQLRERDLSTRDLESLAREAVRVICETGELSTALLINSRTDVAVAVGADGVHLRSDDVSPEEIRAIWKEGGAGKGGAGAVRQFSPQAPLIGVSCHLPAETTQAAATGATFAAFAPVFEKKNAHPTGLTQLREACKSSIPVLALGGITLSNAHSCLEAGAAGIAAIRLFQENNIVEVVERLHQKR